MRRLMPLTAALLALVLLAGCGQADPTDSDQYRALATERDELADDLESTERRLDRTKSSLEETEAELEAANARNDELVERYDPQIHQERLDAYNAEAVRACDAAKADIDASIDSLVNYDDEWERIGNEEDLIALVTDCAAGERAKTAEQREAERLAGCATVDVDGVVKDPDAHVGTCYVVFARIFQFDSRTGKCSFLANMSTQPHEYNFEYGDSGLFSAGILTEDCPELDGIDADDHIKLWATVDGAFDYDTAIGGTNSVPQFTIEKVELVRKE